MKYFVSPIAIGLCLFASAAQAHSHLESSTPKEGSTVTAAPSSIELKFSEAVRVTALSIQKGEEKPRPLSPLPDKPTEKVSVAVPALDPGKYAVNYRVVSDDNHIMAGTLHFTVSASQAMDHSKMKMDGANPTDHH
jgi:methionine-rich copper-binding protein CopC